MAATLSVAMIVKNEASFLEDCLASIQSVSDELCIIDTGSHDETVSIARRFNAKMGVFIWCDDFSAARNESLRLATCNWVLILDADEKIAPEDLPRLKALINGPMDRAYSFTTRNYTNSNSVGDFTPSDPNDPLAAGFAGWYPSDKIRLFPNNRDIVFSGKVHELVTPSVERARLRVVKSDIPVHHYAMAKPAEKVAEKRNMYLQLGHEKVKQHPDNPKAYSELGNQYAEVGAYEQAAAAYRNALKLEPSNVTVLKDLGGVLHLLKRNEEAKKALHLAAQLAPNTFDIWRNLSVVYYDEGNWTSAADVFERALSIEPGWTLGRHYYAAVLERLGRLDDAAVASRQVLETDPDNPDHLKQFVHIYLRLEKRAEARACLEALLPRSKNKAPLANALGELFYYDQSFDESKKYFQMAGKLGIAAAYNNLGVVFFMEQNLKEAQAAFEQCLAADPTHRGARENLAKVMAKLG